MKTLRAPFALFGLLLSLACDQDGDKEPAYNPQTNTLNPRESACQEHTRTHSDLMTECFASDETTDADIALLCAIGRDPQSVWYTCVREVGLFAACGEDVGCESWYGADCWDSYRSMMQCFGEADPGVEVPSCPYTGDGECDEPEGTFRCFEGTDVADCEGGGGGGTSGDAPSCDPSACSGCETSCDDYGCYQCCWSCNGSSCEQSCNF